MPRSVTQQVHAARHACAPPVLFLTMSNSAVLFVPAARCCARVGLYPFAPDPKRGGRSADRRTISVVAFARRDGSARVRRGASHDAGRSPLGAPPWRFSAGGRASISGIASGSVQRCSSQPGRHDGTFRLSIDFAVTPLGPGSRYARPGHESGARTTCAKSRRAQRTVGRRHIHDVKQRSLVRSRGALLRPGSRFSFRVHPPGGVGGAPTGALMLLSRLRGATSPRE